MTGYNEGKTAQEVAEIITEMRHAETTHKPTVSESEKAKRAQDARRRIEEIEDEKKIEGCEIYGLGIASTKILSAYQKKRIRETNEKSGYGKMKL